MSSHRKLWKPDCITLKYLFWPGKTFLTQQNFNSDRLSNQSVTYFLNCLIFWTNLIFWTVWYFGLILLRTSKQNHWFFGPFDFLDWFCFEEKSKSKNHSKIEKKFEEKSVQKIKRSKKTSWSKNSSGLKNMYHLIR